MHASHSKQSIRQQMRQKRRALDENQQDQAASGLLSNLLKVPAFMQAKRISLYFPNDGEIDPTLVMIKALEMAKRCYYPVISPSRKPKLFFAQVKPGCRLKPDRMGILTPIVPSIQWLKPSELDVILLPLVSFDSSGARVGMGGGFYDASLAFLSSRVHWCRPRLIGIAHEIQKAEKITLDHWDVPVQMIVTDQAIYKA